MAEWTEWGRWLPLLALSLELGDTRTLLTRLGDQLLQELIHF